MSELSCRISGIDKAFGDNRVLRKLNLDLPAGTVTALMGANGAGKSTLVKILSGVHERDAGAIVLMGEPFTPTTPSQALRAGVVTVHQNINDGVIPDLDVASNLLVDRLAEADYGFLLKRRRMLEDAREIAAAMDLAIDVRAPVSGLGVADRQLIAIARAMAHSPKLLILDEPTSSLSAAEAERLFGLIEKLQAKGVAILYISHRMSDIRRIADRVVSMRDGEISGVFEGPDIDYDGAVNAMLGHRMTEVDFTIPESGTPIVALRNVQLKSDTAPFSLDLKQNEIVVVTGLLGSGKTALAQSLFGIGQPHAGTMSVDGTPYAPQSPGDAIARGVFMSPKDRASNAVIRDFDLTRNVTVPFLARFGRLSFVDRAQERAMARQMIDGLSVVCQGETDDIGTLSGGNQQKVVLSRWLSQPCRLLVLDEPFQGVDIRARRDIGHKIRETAANRATLVLAAELDEAFEIADRIVVFHEHTVAAEFKNENVDVNAVLAAVTGSARQEGDRRAA